MSIGATGVVDQFAIAMREAGIAPPAMRRAARVRPQPFADAVDPYEDDGGWVSWGGSRRWR